MAAVVHHSKFDSSTSGLGQKQTLQPILLTSALPPKADIGTQPRDVRASRRPWSPRGKSIAGRWRSRQRRCGDDRGKVVPYMWRDWWRWPWL